MRAKIIVFCCLFLVGYILDITEQFEYVYIFSGSLLLLAAFCLLMIPVIGVIKRKLSHE